MRQPCYVAGLIFGRPIMMKSSILVHVTFKSIQNPVNSKPTRLCAEIDEYSNVANN